MGQRICSVDDCDGRVKSRGWCGKHYMRWWATGRLDLELATPAERWAAKVADRTDADACWIWCGARTNGGYGKFSFEGSMVLAHRFAFEHFVGPIPESTEVDHRCRNRSCVNPRHLRLATAKQNREHQGLSPRNTSGFRGVQWDRRRGRWTVRVKHHGINHYGGSFESAGDANGAAVSLRNRLFTHNDLDRRRN